MIVLILVYISFIGLGLPDTLLGAAWPSMYNDFVVPLAFAGIVSVIVSLGTIFSSLTCSPFIKKFGTAKITFFSVGLTIIGVLGYSFSNDFFILCLFAVPLGIGAGGVDVALNNYAALHFKAKHMNWLHAFWGIGATLSPIYLSVAYSFSATWREAYQGIGITLILIFLLLLFSIPYWKNSDSSKNALKNKDQKKLPKTIFLGIFVFFVYSAVEMTAGLWCGSYLSKIIGLTPAYTAMTVSGLFFSVTFGRILNGFLSLRFSNRQLIRMGIGVLFLGIMLLLLPNSSWFKIFGIFLLGLGCSPIYPSLIHETPIRFGKENSSKAIGLQMAASYAGTISMPPLFGLMTNYFSLSLFPFYIGFFAILLLLGIVLLDSLTKKNH